MKKLIAALLILFAVGVLSSYVLLPATQKLDLTVNVGANQQALLRKLVQQSLQQKGDSTGLILRPGMFNNMVLSVPLGDTVHNSMMELIALGPDSTAALWRTVVQGGSAPWQRWHTWQLANELQKNVQPFLSSLHQWESEEQLYGLNIRHEKNRDTVLMATRFETAAYPDTKEIYDRVGLLQQYIQGQGASVTNYPMLHVAKEGGRYKVMVGLPCSRQLPGSGAIEVKRMVMGNVLTTEVMGSSQKVEEGMRQLEYYVSDHGLVSPAIPFASLITDRTKEPDSTKWVTKLTYPVF